MSQTTGIHHDRNACGCEVTIAHDDQGAHTIVKFQPSPFCGTIGYDKPFREHPWGEPRRIIAHVQTNLDYWNSK